MRRMFSKNQLEEQSIELLGSGKVPSIKGDEIIENMEGYGFETNSFDEHIEQEYIYVSAVKNGNKLTFVLALNITKGSDSTASYGNIGYFTLPSNIMSKLIPTNIGGLANGLYATQLQALDSYFGDPKKCNVYAYKDAPNNKVNIDIANFNFSDNTKYYLRVEMTFLLSENFAE